MQTAQDGTAQKNELQILLRTQRLQTTYEQLVQTLACREVSREKSQLVAAQSQDLRKIQRLQKFYS